MKGYALRVGGEVWIPRNATEADHEAAWAMMTPEEQKRTARRTVRAMRWMGWRMKHPKWAAFIDGAAFCGSLMLGARG